LNCNFNKIIASGGGPGEPINMVMLDKNSSTNKPPKFHVTDDSVTVGQDIVRSEIDKNNNYFILINSWKTLQLFDQNGYPVGNKFSKHVAVIWVNDSFNFPKYTSELAKTIGDFSGLAPIQVDHFMNRYFGTTAGLLGLMTTSMLARARGDILPEQSIREVFLKIPSSGSFLAREHGSRNVTDFYELAEIVDKAVQSANKFKGLDYNKYQEYLDKDNNRELVIMQGEMRRISDQLSLLRSHENKILASKNAERYTPTSKKEQLDSLKQQKREPPQPGRQSESSKRKAELDFEK
jgi:hypothetical protein